MRNAVPATPRSSDMTEHHTIPRFRQCGLVLLAVALPFVGVAFVSEYALLNVVVHGVGAVVVVAPPVLMGLWLVSFLPLGAMPPRWQFLIGSALGLGLTSLLVLLLGTLGLLQRPLWIVLMAAFVGVGLLRLRTMRMSWHHVAERDEGPRRDSKDRERAGPGNPSPKRQRGVAGPVACARGSDGRSRMTSGPAALWLIVVPFASAALLAASNPPGLVWSEEGYGYDTLEYHLQLPKQYRQAGRIAYAPNNVYGSFPANVEMLYLLGMILHDEDVDFGITANMIHLLLAAGIVYAAWVAGREWSQMTGVVCGVIAAGTGWLTYLSGLAYVENGMLFFGMVACAALLHRRNAPCKPVRAIGDRQSEPQAPARGSWTGRLRSRLGWVMKDGEPMRFSWLILAGALAGFSCGCKYTAVPMIALPLSTVVLFLPSTKLQSKATGFIAFTAAAFLTVSPWLIKNLAATGNPAFPLANSIFAGSPPGWGAGETLQWDRAHRPLEAERSLGARLTALWKHVPADPYQRFGPVLLLLALGGLCVRRLAREDGLLVLIVVIQLLVWLFATHLFARFAVVLLIPLILLAGRAVGDAASNARRRIVVALVVVGSVYNFLFAARLLHSESAAGATSSLIYEGRIPGYEYFAFVNQELPDNARILLVGDARAFYFQRSVDYCVVFNRNPFVEAVRTVESDRAVVDWLTARGYTHVLVNWSEVRRLARTYGFASEITPALFERLSNKGLSLVREFNHPQSAGPYVSIYAVPGVPTLE